MRYLVLLSALALIPGEAPAGGCHVAAVRAAYVAPVYHAPVYYPLYTVSFSQADDKLIGLVEKQSALIERLSLALQAGPQANTLPLRAAPDGRQVLAAKCTACHNAADAERRGGGLAFTGQLDRLSAFRLKQIRGRIHDPDPARRMPPGKPLSAEELAAVDGLAPVVTPAPAVD